MSVSRQDIGASLGAGAMLLAAIALPLALLTWWGGVGFARPTGFALALAALPLLLLFMLKARRPRRAVGSLIFWRGVAQEQEAKSPFKRLRQNLVLVLLLLALAALVYGAAEPMIQAHLRTGRALLLVVDTSASMSTRDGPNGESRLELARERARRLLAGLGRGDHAALVAVDAHARLLCRWSDDEAVWAQALDELEARPLGTDLGAGLLAAADAAADAPGELELVLLSDGGGPPPPPLELGAPLSFLSVGTATENLGFVAHSLRPGETEGAWEVFATLRNTGRHPRAALVALEHEGRPVAARRVQIVAGGEVAVRFDERLEPGALRLRVVAKEGLETYTWDDELWLRVPRRARPRSALYGARGARIWQRALEAAGAEVVQGGSSGEASEAPTLAVVLADADLERLPASDAILVQPEPVLVSAARLAGPSGPLHELVGGHREPLLEYVSFADLQLAAVRGLTLGAGARPLIEGRGAGGERVVAAAVSEQGGYARIVLGFDPVESRWPQRASFPIFVANCLARAGERAPLTGSAGQTLQLPSAAPALVLVSPSGVERELTASKGEVSLTDLWERGVYRLRVGAQERLLSINLAAPEESLIAPRERLEAELEQVSATPERARPLEVGRWFALLGLALLTLEAWAFHRRW